MATMAATSNAVEMSAKGRPLSLFAPRLRPLSDATVISYSEWEEDGSSADSSGSEFEEESDSPRGSFETATSYDEAPTPKSLHPEVFPTRIQSPAASITGPRGPHLFRSSLDSYAEHALQMSPLLPQDLASKVKDFVNSPISMDEERRAIEHFNQFVPDAKHKEVKDWTSEEVALWMYQAGFEEAIIEKLEEHDVNGKVLLNMQFEDLRELNIPSFGKRRQMWNQLGTLREDGRSSPAPTIFESRPSTRTTVRPGDQPASQRRVKPHVDTPIITVGGGKRRRGTRVKNVFDQAVTPGESVSIVAIEQLLPRAHKCSKGENCPKYRKQQRILEQLGKEFGFAISPAKGGHIFLAGNIDCIRQDEKAAESTYGTMSDVQPSVVASSDLLGPGQAPEFALDEETLETLQTRDPQDNVKQFLSFQHVQTSADSPPSPPLETPRFNMADAPPTPSIDTILSPQFPPQPMPLQSLQQLPKLSIPRLMSTSPRTAISPCQTAISPPPANIYRRGTPASEMDIPLTSVPINPVSRDTSQSVPPNMRYHPPQKYRPSSTAKLTSLPEDAPLSTRSSYLHTPVKSPIRVCPKVLYGAGTTHSGYMKKRKTRFLRHEWAEHHFRLKGTNLAMHASARPDDRKALETINIEEYSVACSSIASNSKLAAALKNLRISSGKRELSVEEAAFAFQLIPATERARALSLLRDGKTHHFTVKSRDDRIDWMREVMLAKAARHKLAGFEVSVNGEMI